MSAMRNGALTGSAFKREQRAEETFVGLRRLGKGVTLISYDGEAHHPGSWSVENATDCGERIFDWLARHLAPRSGAAAQRIQ